jgi:hypothetical protein
MTCGCSKKKKRTQVQESVDYTPNGGGTVRLGLKGTVPLPIRLPEAINGRDIIVLANKRQAVPNLQAPAGSQPALLVVGRNAHVETAHKDQLVAKWPTAFHAV